MRRPPVFRRCVVVLFGFGLLALTAPVASAAPVAVSSAYVRINQLGYPSAGPKQAFVMAGVDEGGGSFSVVDVATNTSVFTGTLPASAGSWSQTFGFVHPLRFGSVTAAGRYRIKVTGAANATSPVFRIGGDGALYRQALANSLSYYGNARDGADYIASALRTAPAHLHDANAMTYQIGRASCRERV